MEARLDVLDSVFFGFDLRAEMWYDHRLVRLKVGQCSYLVRRKNYETSTVFTIVCLDCACRLL